jgi:hypothetical protein
VSDDDRTEPEIAEIPEIPETPETPEPAAPTPELSEYADPAVDVLPVLAETRRYPSTIGGAIYLLALAASVAGIVIVTRGHWRTGIVWIACSLLGAALGRLVLPRDQAGMLEVRRRSLDVLILSGLGLTLLALVASIKAR